MKEMTFVQAMKDYFKVKPQAEGVNPSVVFLNEIRALDDKDRREFKALLEETGEYKIVTSI